MGVFMYQVISCIGVILLSCEVHGKGSEMLLAKHMTALQEYIMAGYGDGWRDCDIFSDNFEEAVFYEDIPHFAITLEKLLTIDIGYTLSNSHCLLASYEVSTLQNLASVMEFGWKAIQHKRIAMILKMGSGLTLYNTLNMTKLPFPVAAEVEDGEEQFICPFIGEVEPILQEHMCDKSYVSLEKKILRIGMVGFELFATKNGLDGTDVRLLKELAKKFGFAHNIIEPATYYAAVRLSAKRDADFMLTRGAYRQGIAVFNDYLGPVGSINFRFLSTTPEKIQNYLTLINPFDGYIWAFLLASFVTVTITLIIIDTMYASWTNTSKKDIIYEDVLISIGLIIDENQKDEYFHKEPCAKARELLVIKWAMVGFLLTICYKEILLSKLINIEYERGLDSVGDVLRSNKPVVVDGASAITNLLNSDPREEVKEIGKMLKPYKAEKGVPPMWVTNGLSKSEHVVIGAHSKRIFYASKEVLWTLQTAFYLPKASPLQRDIHMAIAWWMDTGIHFKMAADVRADYGSDRNYWQRPKIGGDVPLGFSHVVPSFIFLGVATFISTIAFGLEILHYLSVQNEIKKSRRRLRQKHLRRILAEQIMAHRQAQQKRSTMKPPKIPKRAFQ